MFGIWLKVEGYCIYVMGKWNLGYILVILLSVCGFDCIFIFDLIGVDNFEKKFYLLIYGELLWFVDGELIDFFDDFYFFEFFVDKMFEFFDGGEIGSLFFGVVLFQVVYMFVQVFCEFIEWYDGVYDEGWEVF